MMVLLEPGKKKQIFRTDNVDSPYFEIDLKNNEKISKIIIYNRDDCCHDRLVQFNIIFLDEMKQKISTKTYKGKTAKTITLNFT